MLTIVSKTRQRSPGPLTKLETVEAQVEACPQFKNEQLNQLTEMTQKKVGYQVGQRGMRTKKLPGDGQ